MESSFSADSTCLRWKRGHSLVEAILALLLGVLLLGMLLSALHALQLRLSERTVQFDGSTWRLASDPSLVRESTDLHAAFATVQSRSEAAYVIDGACDEIPVGRTVAALPDSASHMMEALDVRAVSDPAMGVSFTLVMMETAGSGGVVSGVLRTQTQREGDWSYHVLDFRSLEGGWRYAFARRSLPEQQDVVEVRRTRFRTETASTAEVSGPTVLMLPDPRRGSGAWSSSGQLGHLRHAYVLHTRN